MAISSFSTPAAGMRIGVQVAAADASELVLGAVRAEEAGLDCVWLTSGGTVPDPLVVLAAAATATSRIELGTSIVPILPRHPLAVWQSVMAVQQLSGGRLRLGLGASTRRVAERTQGIAWPRDPVAATREYVTILQQISSTGRTEFDGEYYSVRERVSAQTPTPILISALRRKAFEIGGEVADGVITWVAPRPFIQSVGRPAVQDGAARANRPTPPIITHVAVAATSDRELALAAFKRQLGIYPRIAEYRRMFRDLGFQNPGGEFEDGLLDQLVISGSEDEIHHALDAIAADGFPELLISPLDTGNGVGATVSALGSYRAQRRA